MLTENDVVQNVKLKLESLNYKIVHALNTNEKGIDIIAEKNSTTLFIEAKGATSSKEGTNRYGKEFTLNQVEDHVAKALLATAKILSQENYNKQHNLVGIALPDNRNHRKVVEKVKLVLIELKINIFWVQETGRVIVEGNNLI